MAKTKAKTESQNATIYRFNIQSVAKKRGIETAGGLWTFARGRISSKETASDLWNEKLKMIRLDTVNMLCDLLNCEPKDLFTEVE